MKNGAPQGPVLILVSRLGQIGAKRCMTMK
jgi:hypothetical protein